MTKYGDLHTHTKLCNHATGEMEEYLLEAKRKGLAFLGVSDHFPYPQGYDASYRMMSLEYNMYRDGVAELQKKGEALGVEVLYSVEFDYVPGKMREVTEALAQEAFDYTIGSIHYVDDFAFDDPGKLDTWNVVGVDNVWMRYADLMCDFVNNFSFNVMAHPDLPKKFGLFPAEDGLFKEKMASIFEVAARKNVFLELNTAGLRKEVGEIYPSLELLLLAKKAGMNVTFGSDAHDPKDVGAGFAEARNLAEKAGYKSSFVFRKGVPVELPFG